MKRDCILLIVGSVVMTALIHLTPFGPMSFRFADRMFCRERTTYYVLEEIDRSGHVIQTTRLKPSDVSDLIAETSRLPHKLPLSLHQDTVTVKLTPKHDLPSWCIQNGGKNK